MKYFKASFSKMMLLTCFSFITSLSISQDIDHIILEATSSEVTIRKYSFVTKQMENFKFLYSAKHRKLLLDKTDFEMYPDDNMYMVKARFKMFDVKGYKDDPEKALTHISVKYYYLKTNPKTSQVEEHIISQEADAGGHYPGLRSVDEIIQKDQGEIWFIVGKDTHWLMQNTGNPNEALFYISQNKSIPLLNFAIMLSNLKRTIVNGEKVN